MPLILRVSLARAGVDAGPTVGGVTFFREKVHMSIIESDWSSATIQIKQHLAILSVLRLQEGEMLASVEDALGKQNQFVRISV